MTFWAQRNLSNGAEAHDLAPAADTWIETAARRLLVSVMPQFEPILKDASDTLQQARQVLNELRQEQRAIRAEIVVIREQVELIGKFPDDQ